MAANLWYFEDPKSSKKLQLTEDMFFMTLVDSGHTVFTKKDHAIIELLTGVCLIFSKHSPETIHIQFIKDLELNLCRDGESEKVDMNQMRISAFKDVINSIPMSSDFEKVLVKSVIDREFDTSKIYVVIKDHISRSECNRELWEMNGNGELSIIAERAHLAGHETYLSFDSMDDFVKLKLSMVSMPSQTIINSGEELISKIVEFLKGYGINV